MTKLSLHRDEFHRHFLGFDSEFSESGFLNFFGSTAPNMAATTPVDPAKKSEPPVVMNHIISRMNRVLLFNALV